LSPRGAAVHAAGLLLTMATWFRAPELKPTWAVMRRREALPPEAIRPMVPGGLSGIPRLIAHEMRWTSLVASGLVGVGPAVVLGMAGMLGSRREIAAVAHEMLLLPDRAIASNAGIEALAALMWFALFGVALTARLPGMIRHLTVLPVGRRRINALLIGYPALVWTCAAAAILALRYALTGVGPTGAFVALVLLAVGVSVLLQAMTLRLTGPVRHLTFGLGIGVLPLAATLTAPSAALTAVAGAVLVVTAAAVNDRTLARSATYRVRYDPAIGVIPLPDQR
jgi:hypothetical protein